MADVAQLEPGAILSVGVDWLTGVCSQENRRRFFYSVARELREEALADGNKLRTWGGHGYHGWQCGHVAYGEREADSIINIGADVAAREWRRVASLATSVPRLDAQVTAWWPADAPDWAAAARTGRLAAAKGITQASTGTAILGDYTGATYYIGAPASDRRARLYAKSDQEPDRWPARSWRWEVQYRRRVAKATSDRLGDSWPDGRAILGLVHNHFARRGARPPYDPAGSQMRVEIPRRASDSARSLEWLRTQVRPTLAWLDRLGLGQLVDDALGRSMFACPAECCRIGWPPLGDANRWRDSDE